MAKNITINGVNYSNVASVKIPLTEDPESFAFFYDTDSGDATQGGIRAAKAWVDGVEVGNVPEKSSST